MWLRNLFENCCKMIGEKIEFREDFQKITICRITFLTECYDKAENCEVLKNEGKCRSTNPTTEYEVKTNCLVTCGFCSEYTPLLCY